MAIRVLFIVRTGPLLRELVIQFGSSGPGSLYLLAGALVALDARVRAIGIAALAVITMQVQGFANGATMGASAAGAAVYTDSGCKIPCSGPGISARFMQQVPEH